MIERLEIILAALGELERGAMTPKTQEEAVRAAHKLAGSLGTYGLMQGSMVAKQIETRLEGQRLEKEDGPWLRTRVGRIQQILRAQQVDDGTAPKGREEGSHPVGMDPPARTDQEASPLGTLLRLSLDALAEHEQVVAGLVREAGRHAGGPASRLALTPEDRTRIHRAQLALRRVAAWLDDVGFDPAARGMRALAVLTRPGLSIAEVARLAKDVLVLHGMLVRRARSMPDGNATVWVVSPDAAWRSRVGAALEVAGNRVRLASAPPARQPHREKAPAGLILDGPAASDPAVLQGVTHAVQAPVVVAVTDPDLNARVRAGRGGAARVVARAAPARTIAVTMRDLLRARAATQARILVVDDDETVLDAVRAILESAGYRVTAVTDPRSFWDALERSSPDLVVTDLDMPGVDGADLCMALRTEPRWENVPVVFLSSKGSAANLRRVFEAGADDFVSKPLDPRLLLARVGSRLVRLNTRSATGHLDPVTRLPTGPAFEESLDGLVAGTQDRRNTISVGVVQVDNVTRHQGEGPRRLKRHEARLARILCAHVDPPSLLGHRGPHRFLVAFPGMDAHDATAVLRRVITDFQAQDAHGGVTASAGVAQKGVHGKGLPPLLDAAGKARAQAERSGGSRVFIAGGTAGARRLEKVDVLVVDDDPTIGELLLDTLAQFGWTVAWEAEPERAVLRLSGPRRDLAARVVLLDVNMPGMDGLTVLRLLGERAVVPPTRVIMLTVRAREDEVVRALGLGAADHVAKPFSLGVLTSRVKRALEG